MIRSQGWPGLGPVGFTVAAACLALLASAATPTPVPDRIAANEAAAIDALRRIAAAQDLFQAAVDVDTNGDGVGEYGYFEELGGRVPMRIGVDGVPASGSSVDLLAPPLLRRTLGTVTLGCVSYHGYLFQMWLPDAMAVGMREDASGGKATAPFPDSIRGARLWCCYAWPIHYEHTGKRAFFVNQRGVVLEYSNRSTSPFSGRSPFFVVPWFDEAYSVPDDMSSAPRIGVPNANGSIWWPVP